jgi:hypothetical protein
MSTARGRALVIGASSLGGPQVKTDHTPTGSCGLADGRARMLGMEWTGIR